MALDVNFQHSILNMQSEHNCWHNEVIFDLLESKHFGKMYNKRFRMGVAVIALMEAVWLVWIIRFVPFVRCIPFDSTRSVYLHQFEQFNQCDQFELVISTSIRAPLPKSHQISKRKSLCSSVASHLRLLHDFAKLL